MKEVLKGVFIPGLSYKSEMWKSVQEKMSIPTISLDLPEYGSEYKGRELNFATYANYLHDKLEESKVSPPYLLIGHSLGGHIATKYAVQYPDEVEGLVLVSTPLRKPNSKVPLIYRMAISAVLSPRLDRVVKKTLKSDKRPIRDLKHRIESMGYVNPEFLVESSLHSVAKCLRDLFKYDFGDDIAKIDKRVLAVYGTKDAPLLAISGTGLYSSFRKGDVMAMECNHSIPVIYPDELAKLIINSAGQIGSSE